MRADNSHLVIAAARRRAAATCKRAVTALRRMETTGAPITFDLVARGSASLPILALQPERSTSRGRATPSKTTPRYTSNGRPGPAARRRSPVPSAGAANANGPPAAGNRSPPPSAT